MPVSLEERTAADAIGAALCAVSQGRRPGSHQSFWCSSLAIAGIRFAEYHDASHRRNLSAKSFSPLADGSTPCFARALDSHQKLRILRVSKKLDLAHTNGNLTRASARPEGRDSLIDKRRADRALLDRQQVVRREPEVSDGERGADLHLKPRPVAIVPWRRGMDFYVERQLDPGRSAQSFAKNFFFYRKLVFVVGVLVVASAAASKILARRLNPVLGRFHDRIRPRAREARLLLDHRGFDFFIG